MNDTLVNIITNIIYIVALLIIVILIFALINYILYTIYSIKEIIVHNTSEDAENYKLKDIYNYKLINYINIINTDNNYKYDISSEFNKEIIVIDMKEFSLTKYTPHTPNPTPNPSKPPLEYIDLSYLKDIKDSSITVNDNKINIKLKNIDDLKPEDFMTLYEKISTALKIDNTEIIVRYNNNDNKTEDYNIQYIKKDDYDYSKKYTINKSLYGDIVSFSKNDTESATPAAPTAPTAQTAPIKTFKKINIDDGIIILYEDKNNNNTNTDIYGYILNGLFLLIPTTLLWSNDKYAAGLYVKTNNDFYEIILLLVFLIIFIILIALINDFYTYIFNISSNSKIFGELFIAKILDKNIHLVVITLCIIIYCIIHSAIYFFVFISGTYKKIKGLYDDLIITDEYIRNKVNNDLISNNYNSYEIIEAFNDIAYGGDISYVKGKYNVIDETTKDIYEAKNKFEEKMIGINKKFNYDKNIYNRDEYTKIFFTKIKLILFNQKPRKDEINKTLLLVLIIYLYFVKNNMEDPYILIKLNKLIFGRVANTGIPEIDEEIYNTLTLRSLMGHNLEKDIILRLLNIDKSSIFTNISNSDENIKVKNKFNDYKKDIDKDVAELSNKLNVELNYWGAVYFFNLYLALEIIIGCFVILAILMVIKYTDNDMKENIERYIDKMSEFIETIVEEIKTAVLGVI
jgi:hypothetical protein